MWCPSSKCKGIIGARMSRFWWGDDATNRKMHLFSWWKMCIPKGERRYGLQGYSLFQSCTPSKTSLTSYWYYRFIMCNYPKSEVLPRRRSLECYFETKIIIYLARHHGWCGHFEVWVHMENWRCRKGEYMGGLVDPSITNKKVLTIQDNNLISQVYDLTDPVTGDWDAQLVNQRF